MLTTLKSSKEQAAYIRSISDNGEPQLRVADDDAEFLLPTLPVADFPPLPIPMAAGPAHAEGFSIETKVLVDALDHVTWAASDTDARYSMTSLCFSFRKGKVEIAATNGRALAVVEVPVTPLGGDAEHLVHNRFAAILAKIARYSAECTEHVAVDFIPGKKNSEGIVHLHCGFVTYTTSMPSPAAQTFPPYRDILAGVEGVFEFQGESAPFLSALKKAAIPLRLERNPLGGVVLELSPTPGIVLSAHTGGRSSRVQYACRTRGGSIRFALVSSFLGDAIQAAHSEDFTVSGCACNRPWIVSNGNGFRAALMPVNLPEPTTAATPEPAATATPEPVTAATAA